MAEQHTELIRFISSIPATENGIVYDNGLNNLPGYQSELYYPELVISALALETLADIQNEKIKQKREPMNPETITGMIIHSDLQTRGKREYLIAQMIILEAFALLYNMEYAVHKLRYVSKKVSSLPVNLS